MRILKFIYVAVLLLTYMLIAALIWLIPAMSVWTKRHYCSKIQSWFCKLVLGILSIKVKVYGQNILSKSKSYLLVGNHLSYLDVIIISANNPTNFVTSVEMKETPLLGWVCRLAGCIFVERRSRSKIGEEIKELSEALEKGLSIVVFPEATSTNGDAVLPFKKPLFAGSINSLTPVLPFCLNYRKLNEEEVNTTNRDLLFWYGGMSFVSHLWKVTGLSKVDVDLDYLEPINVNSQSKRQELAELSQRQVEKAYTKL